MKTLITILILFIAASANAQTFEQRLSDVDSMIRLKEFREMTKKLNIDDVKMKGLFDHILSTEEKTERVELSFDRLYEAKRTTKQNNQYQARESILAAIKAKNKPMLINAIKDCNFADGTLD